MFKGPAIHTASPMMIDDKRCRYKHKSLTCKVTLLARGTGEQCRYKHKQSLTCKVTLLARVTGETVSYL